MSKQGTLHLVYWREYKDDSEKYNPYFKLKYFVIKITKKMYVILLVSLV